MYAPRTERARNAVSSDTMTRLKEVRDFAVANKMLEVEIDGIKLKFDRSAFDVPDAEPKTPEVKAPQFDPDGVCPCGCENKGHNPVSGCGNGCSEERCAGVTDDGGGTVSAGEYT